MDCDTGTVPVSSQTDTVSLAVLGAGAIAIGGAIAISQLGEER